VSVPSVVLKPRKLTPFLHRHPWVLDSAIARVAGHPADGDEVELRDCSGDWIARGIYNSRSRIRVRLYSWTEGQELDTPFWKQRLEQAVRLRKTLGYDRPDEACRLVFSEADALSGLIVDRFGSHLVVQPTALATTVRLPAFLDTLVELTSPASITVRTDQAISRREGIQIDAGSAYGQPPDGPLEIVEHGIRYQVQLLQSQKTGFYLDQRENRRRVASFLSGRRVLDMCCYTGGFSLAASRLGGAAEVVGVDTSEAAVEHAREHAKLNEITNVRFETGDCFQSLSQKAAAGERFSAIILDPPKFARSRDQAGDALRAYHRLNRQAIDLLEPDGVLVTCSCSGSVLREDFVDMLLGVATKTGRVIKILEQRGAAPDHPLNVACTETEYLKCFICQVS
jgi:23S rRNA (cytosine1962-C5)-methyltransferase